MNSNLIVTKNTKWMIKTKKEGEHEVDMTRKRSKLQEKKTNYTRNKTNDKNKMMNILPPHLFISDNICVSAIKLMNIII